MYRRAQSGKGNEKQKAPSRSLSEAHGKRVLVVQQEKQGEKEAERVVRRVGRTGGPEEKNKGNGRYNIGTDGE